MTSAYWRGRSSPKTLMSAAPSAFTGRRFLGADSFLPFAMRYDDRSIRAELRAEKNLEPALLAAGHYQHVPPDVYVPADHQAPITGNQGESMDHAGFEVPQIPQRVGREVSKEDEPIRFEDPLDRPDTLQVELGQPGEAEDQDAALAGRIIGPGIARRSSRATPAFDQVEVVAERMALFPAWPNADFPGGGGCRRRARRAAQREEQERGEDQGSIQHAWGTVHPWSN